MSTLTSQIAGVNLWHGMNQPEPPFVPPGIQGGEERGGAQAGATGLTLSPAV